VSGAETWTASAVVGPLLAALVTLNGRPAFIRAGLVLGSVSTGAAAVGLWHEVWARGPQRHLLGGWGAPLGIELWADGLSVLMLSVTAVVGSTVSLYSTAYFGDASTAEGRAFPAARGARFFAPLWLLLWAALGGICLSADLFNLYVTLEILGLSAAALVTLAVTPDAAVAGMRYLVVSLLGSALFLLGVTLLYVEYGTLALAELATLRPSGPLAAAALASMTAGLAAKTALFPLHAWLPPAHSAAPAPASALLSGLVVKGSFFILVRLWIHVYGGGSPAALHVLGVSGAGAIVWGSLLALRQRSLKRLIAYSTVAQIGYLFAMFPLLRSGSGAWQIDAWNGGVYQILSHALAKGAMFLAAGNISYAVARDSIPAISGIAPRLPVSFVAFGLGGLSLAGLPPTGGFLAKWLLIRSAVEDGQWAWAVLLAVGGLLSAAYVLLVLRHGLGVASDAPGEFRPVPRQMEWAAMALALAAVLLGLRGIEALEMLARGGIQPWR
jgi:formate hydrogenlyase subunit 3/multisubunit Na+/H+ antiporter MnhD subunit